MALVTIWASLVALAILLYVILDGFSLGIALLFPTTKDEKERDILIGSIAPVWDMNQTWLVFGGGAILVAFPMIYGVVFSALYVPLLTFIFGLIFRGVTFEFRVHAGRKEKWNRAFFLGSLVAVFAQGLTLGGLLSGIKVREGQFAGGPFDWLNAFSLMLGAAMIAGYLLLGSTYLIIKTTGNIQDRAYRQAFWAALAVLGFMIAVTVWTPLHYPLVLQNWLRSPRIYFIWAFPLLGLAAFFVLIRSVRARAEITPFICTLIFFLAGYLGLIASIYPFVVPPSLTFADAAAQPETLRFSLWGAGIVLPVVFAYVLYSYSIFRGKVDQGYYH
jgi:cytochrome bd ubiquinol oxidase subunit II